MVGPLHLLPQAGSLISDLCIQCYRDLSRLPVGEQGQLNPAGIGQTMARYATEVIQ